MNLYVGNLPYDVTEQDLMDIFAEYGEVTSVKIVTDRVTGRSKGFGFFIVHKNLLEQGTVTEHKTFFTSILGKPKYEDTEIIRYDL